MFRNWKRWDSLLILLVVPFMIGMFGQNVPYKETVPVVPNESIIIGKVLEYSILNSILLDIKPEQILYRLKILILSSQDVDNKPNFTKTKVGEVLSFYSKRKLSPELFNRKVKARVFFYGDETGGKFWIKNIETIPYFKMEE